MRHKRQNYDRRNNLHTRSYMKINTYVTDISLNIEKALRVSAYLFPKKRSSIFQSNFADHSEERNRIVQDLLEISIANFLIHLKLIDI